MKLVFPALLIGLFLQQLSMEQVRGQAANQMGEELAPKPVQPPRAPPPAIVQAASYLSLDGLSLVVIFDRPVNLSDSIESVERRRTILESPDEQRYTKSRSIHLLEQKGEGDIERAENTNNPSRTYCQDLRSLKSQQVDETQYLVGGIQLCAKLLTKKTLKLLHKFQLHNCIWPSRVQFLVQLAKPITSPPIKISFNRLTIGEHGRAGGPTNERELSVDLNKLPLESLGVPLAPKLALTGPNQVPPCGQFSLSAHLSSPYGTSPVDSIKISWFVERIGFVAPPPEGSLAAQQARTTSQLASQIDTAEQAELKWKALQQLVAYNGATNLVLDAQFLQSAPQKYEFKVSVSFTTSSTTVNLNATHQVSRIDFETPIGTIYGSHILSNQQQLNTNQDLVLLADIQVPDCATNVKQVGLYWQVSDPRVRFDQTYAPYYLARPNTLPEQALLEFRLNLFYGIRVKKFATSSAFIATGDSILDSQISDGLLIVNVGQEPTNGSQLELYATLDPQDGAKYTYQWSCFDGKTAQSCFKSLKTTLNSNSTRYQLGSALSHPTDPTAESVRGQSSGVQLIDRQRQRQHVLRLPLNWLDSDAQLWFGLQRFDRLNPSQQSKTEYALVSVQAGSGPTLTIGPVLIGSSRQRATLRNPLTGAIVLLARAPVIVVGHLGPSKLISSFVWHMPNHPHPLHWTSKSTTNPLTGEQELVTELHLNPGLQVAHAHQQIQLIACTQFGLRATAALNLDVVQGVSQCRIEPTSNTLTNSLVVSVSHCNIPTGLSPVTYQIYLADTTGSDGFIEGARTGSSDPKQQQEDDYINETDETFLEGLSEPITMPQLSPVFFLGTLSTLSLAVSGTRVNEAANSSVSNPPESRVRFGARVCDRLQTCRMFYSPPVGPKSLLPNKVMADNNQSLALIQLTPQLAGENSRIQVEQQAEALAQSIQSMIEAAKRANLAGNSIAAISVLNGAINLGQKMLSAASSSLPVSMNKQAALPLDGRQYERLEQFSPQGGGGGGLIAENRVRDLLQVAMRDCLHYGSQSLQRQLHYTDSGQTNLVTHSMARILSSPASGIELKFKALKLMAQLTRRSIIEQLNLKLNCLADFKSIQAGYESLFGTFSHYSLDSNDKPIQRLHTNNNNNGKSRSNESSNSSTDRIDPTLATTTSNSFSPISWPQQQQKQQQQQQHAQTSPQTGVNRRKREEAILAYLRSVRQAYRSLISAAAIQLPLGDSQQFHYASTGGTKENNSPLAGATSLSNARSLPSSSFASTPSSPLATSTDSIGASDIMSSLAHLTDISTQTIDVDLHELGSISVQFDERLLNKLSQSIARRQLKCRNDTLTKCATFVLSVSSFAGKAPFRALDGGASLQVPIVEVSLLSPIDGSNLLDLLQSQPNKEQAGDLLRAEDVGVSVVFTFPTNGNETQANMIPKATAEPSSLPYKCYQFDEDTNEWTESKINERSELLADQPDGGQRIRCSYNTLGAFGAFRSKPPLGEASRHFSILLVVLSLLGFVFLVSILGCLASNSRAKRRTRKSTGSRVHGKRTQMDDDDGSAQMHPEQTYRNELNYPL